jgi:hypothetical protein
MIQGLTCSLLFISNALGCKDVGILSSHRAGRELDRFACIRLFARYVQLKSMLSDQSFRWERDADPMPGWVLVKLWLEDSTMPRRGLLTLTYNGPTFRSNSTSELQIDVPFRRGLLYMVS